MANSLSSAGATVEPSEYAALAQDEHFTGMWTQRNPLRDADVPWLYRKFYGASRFDSIWDGINREITARLTDARRPGSSVYNSAAFPRINRYYPFRRFDGGQERIQVLADCDAPANQLTNPNFDAGGTGWTLATGWAMGTGSPFHAGNLAVFTGPGTAAVSNNQHLACTPGQIVTASCMSVGEIGADGQANLRITFYDSGGGQIGVNYNSDNGIANYIWQTLTVIQTAPAGATYAVIDYAVYSSTSSAGRWGCCSFFGGYDTDRATVRDVTGPSTDSILWSKDPLAGKTSFLGVGNVLYAGDGYDTHQWVTSGKNWQPLTLYQPGDFIIDSNNNVQMAVGAVTANVVNLQIDDVIVTGGTHGRKVSLWFDASTPFDVPNNIAINTVGVATVPAGTTIPDGATPATLTVSSLLQCSWVQATTSLAVTAYSPATGTVNTGTGVSGTTPPAWNTALGLATQDGGLQWVNMGPAAMAMGAEGPATAPVISFTQAPSIYPAWAPNIWYAPVGFVIKDAAGNLESMVNSGGTTHTGSGEPSWAPVGSTTTDGTVVWKNLGTGTWIASQAYAVGDVVQATYTYTTITYQWTSDGHGGFIQKPVQTQVTATSGFQCTVAGTSGANPPAWNNGIGTITMEASGLTWKNISAVPSYPGTNQAISRADRVIDPAGYMQAPSQQGKSGAAAPTGGFATTAGATTIDGTEIWINSGAFTAAGTGPWRWAYSGKNSITGEISNPSPTSTPFVPAVNQTPVIQGVGLPQPPWDTIVLWRTAANGSTLLWDDEFSNPGPTATWIYTDTNADPHLNTAIPAPGATGSATLTTPPPSTAVAPEFHCGRNWMIDRNYVIYSGGPDTVTGNGLTAFPPQNYFQLPEFPIKLKSVTMQGGSLLVFCISNVYIILGDGTGTPPFQAPKMYMEGLGIQSYDALCMVGSTFYGMSNKAKAFSLDPGAGYLEIGFPIGDQFKRVTTGGLNAALYDPVTTYVTWHEADSTDTGLYVSDSQVGWFRWSAIAPPESGSLWSPRAGIVDGTSAVQSVEVLPGVSELLIGPHTQGPIRKRDATVSGDWVDAAGQYQGYPAWDVKGSIGLCETGEVAEVAHIALKSLAVGARPVVSLLLDEIQAGVTVEGRTTAWDVLNLDSGHHEDPPNLESSITMYSDRYQTSSTAECPKCENFFLRIDYGSQQLADELLKFAIFGAVFKEKRQQ